MPEPQRDSILVVEDSHTQLEQLRHILEEACPAHDICCAANGAVGLAEARMRRPRLIISDIQMPVMDGYAMCSALKKDPVFKGVPIILLTSLSDPEDIFRGLNAGTDYYLTKPFEPEFLREKVQSILSDTAGPEPDGDSRWKVSFAGRQHTVHADLQQMLNLLLSTYENAVQNNRKLLVAQEELRRANESLEERVVARTLELRNANGQLRFEVDERMRAEKRLSLQLKRLDALRQVDAAITGSMDLRLTLNVLLDQLTTHLEVDAADVLLLRRTAFVLDPGAARGFGAPVGAGGGLDYLRGPAGRAVRERAAIRLEGAQLEEALPIPRECLAWERFVSYLGVPLIAKAKVVGVLELYSRGPLAADPEWQSFLEALAGQAAIAIDGARLFENLERTNLELFDAYERTLEGWSKALDLRDKETEGHSLRVTSMSESLARQLRLSEEERVHLRRGALLHDIGKLGVPDAVLRKPGPLSAEERKLMEQHPVYAYEWLAPVAFLRPAIDVPYCHHEKWDGTGYPQGLKGERIPLAARIFAVADVWDALRSDRPYRRSWSRERCLAYLRECSGSHFDPAVVLAFGLLYEELGGAIDGLPEGGGAG
ncbi:MAG: response regulator [Candidatus Hydrogenedentes bacterium]|nr:response regulator [Candidatus Hydrogenedentota bacterium]